MFTLLTPAALLALLGLIVPVLIHLWNRRPGREVAVGSLRWLAAGANRRLRNLKPEQLWLLLLRSALLVVLAVALAGPVWRVPQPVGRGQVLVSPELLGTPAFAALRPTIDSLRRRGYALRWLAAGFPKASRAALRADSLGLRDSARVLAATSPAGSRVLWARVRQAASTFSGQPLYVLTPATMQDFQGTQSPLPAEVNWQMLPTAATATWLQAAAIRGDSLRLLLGQSSETQTTFRPVSVKKPAPGGTVRLTGLPAFRFETGTAGAQLQPVGASSAGKAVPAIPVRTNPVRVVIYSTPDFAPDARYLQAGLRAAAAGLLSPMVISTTSTPPAPTNRPDWLFWLADVPLPADWRAAVGQGTQVWQEAVGPGRSDKARLATATFDEVPASIFRRSPLPAEATGGTSYPLWADGQGRPVLSRQLLGRGAIHHLATRLNPIWSELADSPALPARLLALLQPESTDAASQPPTALDQALALQDQRALDPMQLRLSSQAAGAKLTTTTVAQAAAPQSFLQTDLRPWLVLAAGLLFAFERLLAYRRANQSLPSIS
ncbi:BatA domain-containing protein [Hymenobacter arizonensis]|uniref:N-terminal double-transmembrane domain-containing protein n=1 Tax=Hymenobacter arizonensis TaxID=1227077 RepID=A0A1I5ST43_HYMAR|nr:BatA domain-containing protein [Hymenobacter arizonensis]SFP73858.1 N-terminal double-transmembrane domain-containing protein [Hymenobacter arizonensis]